MCVGVCDYISLGLPRIQIKENIPLLCTCGYAAVAHPPHPFNVMFLFSPLIAWLLFIFTTGSLLRWNMLHSVHEYLSGPCFYYYLTLSRPCWYWGRQRRWRLVLLLVVALVIRAPPSLINIYYYYYMSTCCSIHRPQPTKYTRQTCGSALNNIPGCPQPHQQSGCAPIFRSPIINSYMEEGLGRQVRSGPTATRQSVRMSIRSHGQH